MLHACMLAHGARWSNTRMCVPGLIRNPLKQAAQFLTEHHGNHVKCYNLCIEKGAVDQQEQECGVMPLGHWAC